MNQQAWQEGIGMQGTPSCKCLTISENAPLDGIPQTISLVWAVNVGNWFLSMENWRLVTMLMIMIHFFGHLWRGFVPEVCSFFLICGLLGQSYMDTLIL